MLLSFKRVADARRNQIDIPAREHRYTSLGGHLLQLDLDSQLLCDRIDDLDINTGHASAIANVAVGRHVVADACDQLAPLLDHVEG
jgi:hypothetical protein